MDAFGDLERRPTAPVLLIPHLDIRAAFGQKPHGARHLLVRGAVHRCLAHGVNGVDVVAQIERQADGFDNF